MRALGPGSLSSFLQIILDVFYWALWVACFGVAVAVLAVLLVSFHPQLLRPDIKIDHIPLDPATVGPTLALVLGSIEIYLVGVIVIVGRLRRIVATMTAGDPFHPDNVRRLQFVGLVLALLEIGRYIAMGLSQTVLHGKLHLGGGVNLTAWFAVLVIVVLAEVFREGARLRRDAELTI